MGMRAKRWPKDHVDMFIKLWVDEKRSSTFISAALGYSRGAVMGQVRRRGLNRGRIQTSQRIKEPVTNAVAQAVKPQAIYRPEPAPQPPKPTVPDPIYGPTHIALVEKLQCRFIVDSEALLCCGQKKEGGGPYCPTHTRLVYRV